MIRSRWPAAVLLSLGLAWLFVEIGSLLTWLTVGGLGLPLRSGDASIVGVGFGGSTANDPALVAANVTVTAPVFAVAARIGVRVALAALAVAVVAAAVALGAVAADRVAAWLVAVISAALVAVAAQALGARRVSRG